MISRKSIGEVTTIGVQKSKKFGIKATAKAFKVLSNTLYPNKVMAVVREIGCNAFDAHVDAGCREKPFLLHLPNDIEPFISFRDYGFGLCEADVFGLYTTYFASDKDESNDFTGEMGLGSKSPLCYTDQFTIKSYHNGECSVYNAHFDSKGQPDCVLLNRFKSDEPSGLEVIVAVKKNDFHTFYDEAANIFGHFEVIPKIVGADIKVNVPQYLVKGNGWGLRDKFCNRDNNVYGVRVIMGNVCYRGINDLKSDNEFRNDCDVQRALNENIDIIVPIGLVDVAPSRETLSFDDITKANLFKVLKKVGEEFLGEVNNTIAEAKTPWEAIHVYYSISKSINSSSALSGVKWNDIAIANLDYIDTGIGSNYVKDGERKYNSELLPDILQRGIAIKGFKTERNNFRDYRRRRLKIANVGSIRLNNLDGFMYADCKKGNVLKRVKKFIEEYRQKKRNDGDADADDSKFYIFPMDEKDKMEAFFEVIGYKGNVIKLSDVLIETERKDKTGRIKQVFDKRHAKKIFKLDVDGINNEKKDIEHWELIDNFDQEDVEDGVYCVINRFKVEGESIDCYLCSYLNRLEKMGIKVPDIYGIKKSEYESNDYIKENWLEFHDWYKAQEREFLVDKFNEDELNILKAASRMVFQHKIINLLKTGILVDILPEYADAVKRLEFADKNIGTFGTYNTMGYIYKDAMASDSNSDLFDADKVNGHLREWDSMVSDLFKSFPIINHFEATTPIDIKRDVLKKLALFRMMENKENKVNKEAAVA